MHPVFARRYNTEPGEVKEEESLNLTSAIWFAWGVLLNSGQCWRQCSRAVNKPSRIFRVPGEDLFSLLKVSTSAFTIIKTLF